MKKLSASIWCIWKSLLLNFLEEHAQCDQPRTPPRVMGPRGCTVQNNTERARHFMETSCIIVWYVIISVNIRGKNNAA